ncbi:Calcineurin-like phosphoesterase [Parapedobacter composti]|uniref:Calcineurin-like phosphoesterase n=1 Tax=Parapedobacter composti TaxID=623281 RepID=A0A1I1IMP4_9SPHI|nr:metallophosphoesterase [Parapedobacter composti]SFC34510.1 Calcineurin-like phosphoesterase [Parapedobacter composti]
MTPRILLLGLFGILINACTPKAEEEITFVLLPDTQTYAEKYPDILDAQINWIEQEAANIAMVIQQGDLTQNNNEEEWQLVRNAFRRLDDKVPYVLAVGNHDMGSEPGKFADVRNTTLFNTFFPVAHMAKLPAFGGIFEEGRLDNAYYLLETGDYKWLVLSLEFGPRESVLVWANDVVADHPDRLVILNTHSYMYSDSTRQGHGDYWRPQGYGIGKDTATHAVNDGEQIWQKLVKKHPNIRFVFSGHVLNSGVGTLVSINEAGFPVYQFLANFQEGVTGTVNGGNGWLRILKVNPKENNLFITTYSPYVNAYREEEAHQFQIRYPYLKTGY